MNTFLFASLSLRFSLDRIALLLVCCALVLVTSLDCALSQPQQSFVVAKVVDGDTIRVRVGKQTKPVRLIGIDAPESSVNERAIRQAERTSSDVNTIVGLGQRSKAHLSSLVAPGSVVRLESDVTPRDRYNRILAYVYLPNGTMANEAMLADGYASPLTVPPNVRYVERFSKASRAARSGKKGLWATSRLP